MRPRLVRGFLCPAMTQLYLYLVALYQHKQPGQLSSGLGCVR